MTKVVITLTFHGGPNDGEIIEDVPGTRVFPLVSRPPEAGLLKWAARWVHSPMLRHYPRTGSPSKLHTTLNAWPSRAFDGKWLGDKEGGALL